MISANHQVRKLRSHLVSPPCTGSLSPARQTNKRFDSCCWIEVGEMSRDLNKSALHEFHILLSDCMKSAYEGDVCICEEDNFRRKKQYAVYAG